MSSRIPRQILTAEEAADRVAGIMGRKEMAHVCDVSLSMVDKWLNPDAPERLPLVKAQKLDTRALELNGEAPFSDLLARSAAQVKYDGPTLGIRDGLLEVTSGVGRLSESIQRARSDSSPGAGTITPNEAAQIAQKLGDLRACLNGVERRLKAESENPFDHSKVTPLSNQGGQ